MGALPYVAVRNGRIVCEDLGLDIPATAEGAKEFGYQLGVKGVDQWMCSSSVDHPDEYGGENIDLRSLLCEGHKRSLKPESFTVLLQDNADREGRAVEVTMKLENGFLHIMPKGYGEPGAADGYGSPVFLEIWEENLRVIVTPNINDEDSKQIIDLEGAREDRRPPEPVEQS